MLTQTLRHLEASKLVERGVPATAARGVEYRLTTLGHSLLGPITQLARWAEDHAAELVEDEGASHV